MRVLRAMTIAAALCACAPAARADELPAPQVRSAGRVATRPTPARTPSAVRRAPRPARPVATRAHGLPSTRPAASTPLPISGPRRSATTRTATYVPPLPGNWVDGRQPKRAVAPRAASAPAPRPRRPAAAALPAPTVQGRIAQVAPAPRRLATPRNTHVRRSATTTTPRTRHRTVVRRATPRRRAVRSLDLTVPCAPGQKPPVAPVRRSLDLIRPAGCCDG